MNSIKRKLIQIAAFGFTNFRIGNFGKGTIYTGKWKEFCTPGMNCYSCPAANFACPIGAMQAVASSRKLNFSFYVVGMILAIGVIFGRAVCGYMCPFGLAQELLFLIKSPKIKLPPIFRYIKYVVLALFVLILPVVVVDITGLGKPWFCEYICPVGTLEAGIPLMLINESLRSNIGGLFYLKLSILLVVIALSVFIFRFFCKVLCPLGAIYGLLNKVSLLHLECDKSKCVECGLCAKTCDMDVNPAKEVRSTECIMCGKCTALCPGKALSVGIKSSDKKNKTLYNRGNEVRGENS